VLRSACPASPHSHWPPRRIWPAALRCTLEFWTVRLFNATYACTAHLGEEGGGGLGRAAGRGWSRLWARWCGVYERFEDKRCPGIVWRVTASPCTDQRQVKLEKLEQLCGKTLSFAVMTDALENFKSLMVKQNTLRTLLLFLPGSSPALRSSSQAARHKSAELCRKINKSHEVLSRHGTDAGSAWARVCFESLEGLCSFAMSFLARRDRDLQQRRGGRGQGP
jgi:hypothetical protein